MNSIISIIIPVYNRASLIKETLQSVVQQSSSQWECIVIDDGSTDETINEVNAFAIAYQNVKIYQRPDSHLPGGNGARNYGALKSTGSYLLFLDSDDLLHIDCVKLRLKFLEQHTKKDLYIYHTGVFNKNLGDSDLLWNRVHQDEKVNDLLSRFINQDMPWHTSGVLWTATFFKSTNMWTEQLRSWQDWELHVRVLLKNPTLLINTSKADNFYRQGLASEKISSAQDMKSYLSSVMVAIKSVYNKDEGSIIDREDFTKLMKRTLIEYPVKKGQKWLPISFFRETNYPSMLLSRSNFISSYVLIYFSWITFIRIAIKKMGGSNWLARYQKENTFLKIHFNVNYES